ncbi:PREDICTED: CDL15_Pgr006381 [Prunus dulcis]|uniref:PREDICTED: CDL15_Pgr006381 n=1 Tax=Prunus dulcis TaxID=3755 RepID=A0A5E4F4V9_PRUDU|nr:PREDICTED: CDL15_Pgr006381 [Prunus dulcis]
MGKGEGLKSSITLHGFELLKIGSPLMWGSKGSSNPDFAHSKKKGANESREGSWSIKDVSNGVIAAATVAGMALLAYGLYGLVSASERRRKTMKAPGRSNRILRDDFQANPKAYFRDLHRK